MKRTGITIVVIIVVVIGGLAAVNFAHKTKTADDATVRNTDQPATGEQAASAFTITGFAFSPASITVKKGTSVTWTNKDDSKHSVISDTDSPMGGLASPLFGKGEQFSFSFSAAGTYKFHCGVHPSMHGTVIVTE